MSRTVRPTGFHIDPDQAVFWMAVCGGVLCLLLS
jgi:hypothetical protein